MRKNDLTIKLTTEEDLCDIAKLWNNGDVMFYVGFPDGLDVDIQSLKDNWLPKINVDKKTRHYSIFHEELGYCGESYYKVGKNKRAALDIKLLPKATGKGIAYAGLKHAIEEAFKTGQAQYAFVDPNKQNQKALNLYRKFGFIEKEHPDSEVGKNHFYLELTEHRFRTYISKNCKNTQ